jgi:hypothetical protein
MEEATFFFRGVKVSAWQMLHRALFLFFSFCTEALYRQSKRTLLPHFPPAPLMKAAPLGTVEDGLREPALGASLTPSRPSPLDSDVQLTAAEYPHSEEFLPFAALVHLAAFQAASPPTVPIRLSDFDGSN